MFSLISHLMILLLVFLTVNKLLASNSSQLCQIQNRLENSVRGRSKAIFFPDGRIITIVGHAHGPRQILSMPWSYTEKSLTNMSNQEFNSMLSSILNRNSKLFDHQLFKKSRLKYIESIKKNFNVDISSVYNVNSALPISEHSILDHATEDRFFLKSEVLNQASKIRFLGIEVTPEVWKETFPFIKNNIKILRSEFQKRKSSGNVLFSIEAFEQILMSAIGGGHLYAYLNNNYIRNSLYIVTPESDEIHTYKEPRSLDENLQMVFNAMDNTLRRKFTTLPNENDLILVAKIKNLYNSVQYMSINSLQEINLMILDIKKSKIAWSVRKPFQRLIESLFKFARYQLSRNKSVAKNLVNIGESGIHFTGLIHLNSTIHELQILCVQEMLDIQKNHKNPLGI